MSVHHNFDLSFMLFFYHIIDSCLNVLIIRHFAQDANKSSKEEVTQLRSSLAQAESRISILEEQVRQAQNKELAAKLKIEVSLMLLWTKVGTNCFCCWSELDSATAGGETREDQSESQPRGTGFQVQAGEKGFTGVCSQGTRS